MLVCNTFVRRLILDRVFLWGGHTRQDGVEVTPTQLRVSPSIQRLRRQIRCISRGIQRILRKMSRLICETRCVGSEGLRWRQSWSPCPPIPTLGALLPRGGPVHVRLSPGPIFKRPSRKGMAMLAHALVDVMNGNPLSQPILSL